MGVTYEEFAWVLFCFSCGSILSNLIVSRLIGFFGVKRVLMATMVCIVVALSGFSEKPTYTTLLGFWGLLSFGFGGSMVVVMSQAVLFKLTKVNRGCHSSMGVSGIGAIGGMSLGLISNSQQFPIDSHFPIVGLAMLTLLIFTLRSYAPCESIKMGGSPNSSYPKPSFSLLSLILLRFWPLANFYLGQD